MAVITPPPGSAPGTGSLPTADAAHDRARGACSPPITDAVPTWERFEPMPTTLERVEFGQHFPTQPVVLASTLTRILAAGAVLLATAASCWAAERLWPLLFAAAGLMAGIGVEPSLRPWLRWTNRIAGWLAGVGATGLVALLQALILELGDTRIDIGWLVLMPIAAGLFVVGLDWWRAVRLRSVAVLSAGAMIPLLRFSTTAALLLGAVWLASCLMVMRRVERELDRASPHLPSFVVKRPEVEPPSQRWTALALVVSSATALVLVIGDLSVRLPEAPKLRLPQGWPGLGLPNLGLPPFPRPRVRWPTSSFPKIQWPKIQWPKIQWPQLVLPEGFLPPVRVPWGWVSLPKFDLRLVMLITLAALLCALVMVVATSAILRVGEHTAALRARAWPVRVLDRLTREGQRRGCPRQGSESVEEFTRQLSKAVLPDPHLPSVGTALSFAFFGRDPVPDEVGAWVEKRVDAAIESHPVHELRRRRRRQTRARMAGDLRRWLRSCRPAPSPGSR